LNKLTVTDLDRLSAERRLRGAARPGALSDVVSRLPALKGRVLQWFRDALRDSNRKWFAAALLSQKSDVVGPLLHDLLRAAMVEPDPSLCRSFVKPLAATSWEEVVSTMVEIADSGTAVERAGFGRALYWLKAELAEAPADAIVILNSWAMREFVRTDDVVTQRCLISGLQFEPEYLDETARSIRDSAVNKARASTDEYVRHRLAIQLGESSGPFMPLVTAD